MSAASLAALPLRASPPHRTNRACRSSSSAARRQRLPRHRGIGRRRCLQRAVRDPRDGHAARARAGLHGATHRPRSGARRHVPDEHPDDDVHAHPPVRQRTEAAYPGSAHARRQAGDAGDGRRRERRRHPRRGGPDARRAVRSRCRHGMPVRALRARRTTSSARSARSSTGCARSCRRCATSCSSGGDDLLPQAASPISSASPTSVSRPTRSPPAERHAAVARAAPRPAPERRSLRRLRSPGLADRHPGAARCRARAPHRDAGRDRRADRPLRHRRRRAAGRQRPRHGL